MTLDDLQQQRDRIDGQILKANRRINTLRTLIERLNERRAELEQQAWAQFRRRLSS